MALPFARDLTHLLQQLIPASLQIAPNVLDETVIPTISALGTSRYRQFTRLARTGGAGATSLELFSLTSQQPQEAEIAVVRAFHSNTDEAAATTRYHTHAIRSRSLADTYFSARLTVPGGQVAPAERPVILGPFENLVARVEAIGAGNFLIVVADYIIVPLGELVPILP